MLQNPSKYTQFITAPHPKSFKWINMMLYSCWPCGFLFMVSNNYHLWVKCADFLITHFRQNYILMSHHHLSLFPTENIYHPTCFDKAKSKNYDFNIHNLNCILKKKKNRMRTFNWFCAQVLYLKLYTTEGNMGWENIFFHKHLQKYMLMGKTTWFFEGLFNHYI